MEISKEKQAERALRKKIREQPLNKILIHETVRKSTGRRRVQFDYTECSTRTEQHTAHVTDINALMKKYAPDELAAYIAARNAHRVEITGHDFSTEPSLQDAKNMMLSMRAAYDDLPENIKNEFPNHLEFLKFIDNEANQEKMIKMGLLKPKEIKELTGEKEVKGSIPTEKTEDSSAASSTTTDQ